MLKVLLISNIIPNNTGGGNLLLRRHLQACTEWNILVVSDGPCKDFPTEQLRHTLLSRILKRLSNSCFQRLAKSLLEITLPFDPREVAEICNKFEPDVILTVAHGSFQRLASIEAHRSGIPLVTIFHDWWPDLAGTYHFLVPYLDKRFKNLHTNSKYSLCVCEGMRNELGMDDNAILVHPVPDAPKPSISKDSLTHSTDDKRKVYYMGNLGDYGDMIHKAMSVAFTYPMLRFEAAGTKPQWSNKFISWAKKEGMWHGYLTGNALDEWVSQADFLLVAMRFDKPSKRFMMTSFPSKISHYLHLRKPIVIWGPEYCSAVTWARQYDCALVVTDPSPEALMESISAITDAQRAEIIAMSQSARRQCFDIHTIQQKFTDAIEMASIHS